MDPLNRKFLKSTEKLQWLLVTNIINNKKEKKNSLIILTMFPVLKLVRLTNANKSKILRPFQNYDQLRENFFWNCEKKKKMSEV